MPRHWTGDGPEYAIEWSGRAWTLRVDDPRPGLRHGAIGPLLGLEGLARRGRWDPEALSGASLAHHELLFDRVQATYAPRDWPEVTVRASWWPEGEDAIELEIEVQTRSVGQLRDLEVRLVSGLGDMPAAGSHRSVWPRDPAAAALSYDGREPDLAALVTGPPGEPLGPWLAPKGGLDERTYIELAHPEGVSRRIHEGRMPFAATRYGLFGSDLERGVVLRTRLRALWAPKAEAYALAERHWDAFRAEPPPLST